jgi:CRISPR/Cas system-associated exonuclease Cas4 (RecB family)
MSRRVVVSPRSELRSREATAWLAARTPGREALVIGATSDAAGEAIRAVALARGSAFGMHRFTLGRLAAELAKHELVERDLAAVGGLPIEALCARVVQRMRREGTLGRFDVVSAQPGLPRALARTLGELRLAGATPEVLRDHDAELAAALVALEVELAAARLADRATVYQLAAAVVADRARHGLLIGLDAVWIDVPVRSAVEQQLIAAIAGRAEAALATVPFGDEGSLARLAAALGVEPEHRAVEGEGSLARVQAQLFAPRRERAELDAGIEIFSAPGESRECVEIARHVLHAAERGVPFDRMAVLLRTTESYRVHLEEALARAAIPVHFDQGTRLPDPTGRAFLALLACAGERLSVRRFAEYLSLGEVPATSEPPPAAPSGDRWVPPEEELLPVALAAGDEEDDDELGEILVLRGGPLPSRDVLAAALGLPGAGEPVRARGDAGDVAGDVAGDMAGDGAAGVAAGPVFAPWRWEQLLVDAAVIGGLDRWERRLAGLEAQLQLEDGDHGRDRRERALADLRQLRAFALPLLRDLAALPAYATWGEWIDRLSALATRAVKRPERVLAVLAALQPMAEVGPIELREVQLVLGDRLAELVVRPPGSRYGKLLVAPIEAARGRSFELVFVPGLAERMFPQKLVEDPLLLDLARAGLPLVLDRRDDRVTAERLALRLAIGAATDRVVLSYPRIDLEQGRPRVPSFYGLEILEAAEGALPGFDELGRRANVTGAARIGWPAPGAPIDAIDEAEHDLALLDTLVHDPAQLTLFPEVRAAPPKMGAAHYLLAANAHLARALRTRARRWDLPIWKPADGLIVSTEEGRAALAAHLPDVRSFSPTALEQFAACPYRFVLRTIVRLEARDAPEPIETIDPLERGSLVHEVQFELLGELRELGLLPVTEPSLATTRDLLDAVLDRVAARYHDKLFPAIERVWNDGISSIRADLREWLRRMADDPDWIPARFELAFGLDSQSGRDPASRDEPVETAIGLTLRGSIDLVEQGPGGLVRATDYKTGKAKVGAGSVIGGGTSLQPVLYALVLEKLLPDAQVTGGRLYYCTTRGDFQDVTVPLDETALASARLLAATLRHHFEHGFFPAAPAKGECTYCDFRAVCGPYEEQRAKLKATAPLVQLRRLREQR